MQFVDEKARLMGYASITLCGVILSVVVPLMLSSIEKESKNTTKIKHIEKAINDFGEEQKEIKEDIKEINKAQSDTRVDVKEIKTKLDIIISMANHSDKELIEKSLKKEAAKRRQKIKSIEPTENIKKLAIEDGGVLIE